MKGREDDPAKAYNELSDAVDAFIERFEPWILSRNEGQKLLAAVQFGREYEKIKELMYEKKEGAE